MTLDDFTRAYLEAALWAGLDWASTPEGEDNPEPFDAWATVDDFAPSAIADAVETCRDFQEANAEDLEAYAELRACYPGGTSPDAMAGHDFLLTRDGHGAGFWDRGAGEVGDRLTAMSKPYGPWDIYTGDDGLIYSQ